jgi:hypothetical protein
MTLNLCINKLYGRVVLLLAIALSSCWQSVPVLALPKDDSLATSALNHAPLAQDRKKVKLNHLFMFERSPMNGRIPVILVPGRAEEYQHNAWWKKINKVFQQSHYFKQHYKLFAYLYDSKYELYDQARDLHREMVHYHLNDPQSPQSVLITYSLGGLITRDALMDVALLARVRKIYAIAVPFHGSPVFEPEWFTCHLTPVNPSPLRLMEDRWVYRFYLYDKKNLTRHLFWNNFDQSEPRFFKQSIRSTETYNAVAAEIARNVSSMWQKNEDKPVAKQFKQKLVVYASFMENGYIHTQRAPWTYLSPLTIPYILKESTNKFANGFLGMFLPAYGFTDHDVFKFVNYQLSNLPTASDKSDLGENVHLFRYNDGVVPLSSALFLPKRDRPYGEDLKQLIAFLDVKQARIFRGIDHTEIGGYAFMPRRVEAIDLLAPLDGKRTSIDWLLYDLQHHQDE